MATKVQTVSALTTPQNGWTFTPTTDVKQLLRRPVFMQGDNFLFTSVGDNLALRVVDTGGKQVLGKDLLLGWDPATEAFTVTAYGRHMEIRASPANTGLGWRLKYQGVYEAEPHLAPDEGGDGDPK
ncbi:MAG: hypothetical protein JNN30_15795 [Rhodanobacteraceae bacterium]|nr:hypothetical protein [Rhodanobacteraceae bacterium]